MGGLPADLLAAVQPHFLPEEILMSLEILAGSLSAVTNRHFEPSQQH